MRKGIAAGVMVALAFVAMLLGAFGVLMESGLRAHAAVDRYQKAYAAVSGKQSVSHTRGSGDSKQTESRPLVERDRVPLAEADRLRAVPGVTSVVPDISVPLVTPTGQTLTAHTWESTAARPVALTGGAAPAGAGQVVLDAGTAAAAKVGVGSTIVLQADAAPRPFRVVGVTSQGTGTAYLAQSQAAVLSGHPDSADALLVFADPGVSKAALRAAAPGLTVATGADRGDVEDIAVAGARTDVIAIGGTLGGLALLIALLVITGLLEASVRDRSRELAVLRAVGATPRQVRRRIVRGTLKFAVPAAAVGAGASLGLGALLHAVMSDKGVLPTGFDLALGPIPVVGALLVTVGAAVGAAWLASRRVSRIKPVEALGETAVEPTKLPRWRVITGGVFLALGLAMAGLTMFVGGQTAAAATGGLVVSLIWGTALLGPAIAKGGIGLLSGPMRWLSPISGRLAADGARSAAVRMAAVITPVALAIGFSGAQLAVQDTVANATKVQSVDGLRADQVLVSGGPGIPHSAYQEARTLPGATAVTAVKRTTVVMAVQVLGDKQLQSLAAQGVEGSTATIDPKVTSGSLADLQGPDTVAVSSSASGGLAVGQTAEFWLGDGTKVTPRVVAVYDSGLGFGDILLSRAVVAAHATTPLDDYLLVSGPADLTGLTGKYAGLHAASKAAYSKTLTDQAEQNGLVSKIAVLAIAGFILIGVVTTLAVATAARRREFTLLRLIGATRRQVLRSVWLETGIILGTGSVVGMLVAGITVVAFAGGVTGFAGLSLSPWLIGAIVAAVAVPGALAVLVPARAMLRRGSPRIE